MRDGEALVDGGMAMPAKRTVRAMHCRRPIAASLLFLCVIASASSSASACIAARGARVVLSSQAMDPDVFVWDSMLRLTNYTAGKFVTDDVLRHTLLVSAGTEAVVVSCRERAARPRFSTTEADAVGIKLSTGDHRGHYGWVISYDLHLVPRGSTSQLLP
jgi:hypothetical protein